MLRMWTYDLAREQSPTLEHLQILCRASLDAGYDAIGLYVEHRFRYPSAPWAAGRGAIGPDEIKALEREFPSLQIVPFINLLGHVEGFLYCEEGYKWAEEPFAGLQGCPSNPDFVAFVRGILKDTIQAFSSNLIHIGGDETATLGKCPKCAERVLAAQTNGRDGKAVIYAEHFGPLIDQVLKAGRTPALWGDMLLQHPEALPGISKEALIFDWQYFESPRETSKQFIDAGFDTYCCPALHTYNAAWLHIQECEKNVRDSTEAAKEIGAKGVCLATWECELFGNYETMLPIIKGAAAMMNGAPNLLEGCPEEDREWARLMGVDLAGCGGIFGFSRIRSALKCRLLLYGNPFLLWLRHRGELCGEVGDQALEILDHAIAVAPDTPQRGVSEFVRSAIEFVRFAEQAHQAYAQGLPGVAVASLAPTRQIFENLARTAHAAHARIGGSRADIERCRMAKEHVQKVMLRIKDYGDGSLGHLPSFETLTHPNFTPHDQGNWWLINRWARE